MSNQKYLITNEVSWKVDDIIVEGTYARPPTVGTFPAVVMVAGSGPTDRNWNSPLLPGSRGSAGLLAEYLTTGGYITLRYDKRASGPHAKENLGKMRGHVSMQSHLDELSGAVKLLLSQSEVDREHVFVLANSEGCIHVLNYQLQVDLPSFAGLILVSPPARPVGAVARSQIAAQLQTVPGGDNMLAEYDQTIEDFKAGRPVQVDENLPAGLRNLIQSVVNPANQPFSRQLWDLDPAAMLARVTAPVLILIGKKDIQVDWQTEGSIFDAIAERHENIKTIYPENANHVLKYEPKTRSQLNPAEVQANYNAESANLDDMSVQIILSWLEDHMQG